MPAGAYVGARLCVMHQPRRSNQDLAYVLSSSTHSVEALNRDRRSSMATL